MLELRCSNHTRTDRIDFLTASDMGGTHLRIGADVYGRAFIAVRTHSPMGLLVIFQRYVHDKNYWSMAGRLPISFRLGDDSTRTREIFSLILFATNTLDSSMLAF